MMMPVVEIIKQLKSTSSRNEKEAILLAHKDNELLKRVFKYASCPLITFGITSKNVRWWPLAEGASLEARHLAVFQDLMVRLFSGADAKFLVEQTLYGLHVDDAILFMKILDKNLDCGVQAKTINKIWNDLVFEPNVMLVSPENEKTLANLPESFICQKKMDGARVNFIFEHGGLVSVVTRNGRSIDIENTPLSSEIKRLYQMITEKFGISTTGKPHFLDGEILYIDDSGEMANRKKGNGIVNKAIGGSISEEEKKNLRACIWDFMELDINNYKSSPLNLPYHLRFRCIEEIVHDACESYSPFKYISLVETHWCDDLTEAKMIVEDWISEGYEGAVLKDPNGIWEPKRVKSQVKIKGEEEADLEIVAVVEGKGKYKGSMGALLCRTSDGLLEVSVGSGFTDEDRKRFWDNQNSLNGSIVTVRYNTIIGKKGDNMKSLYLPRYLNIRLDKDVANKLADLKG